MKSSGVIFKNVKESMRFNGRYHLSEGVLYLKKIKSMPHNELKDLTSDIFTAGRSKRVYTEKKHGVPYLSNSDVVKLNPFQSCNYNSKKYAYDSRSVLKEGMIVTGRVGAIGQTALINSIFEKEPSMGSDNIIRIVASDRNKTGMIYSFLISKYGQALFSKLATGGVQPYISEEMLLDMPIPQFKDSLELKINELISNSSRLKLESFELSEKAKAYFDKKLILKKSANCVEVKKSSSIKKFQNRLDASFNILKKEYDDIILKSFKNYKSIGSYKHQIFIPNRGKRNYTIKGLKYLSTTDISSFNYTRINKFLSLGMKGVETLKVKENWILIARSGQEILGDAFYVNKAMNGLGVNEHALRLVVNEEDSLYIYAFLSSNFGKKYLRSGIFGSAILTINDDFLRTILIPQLDAKEKDEITRLVIKSNTFSYEAIQLENEAIALVEKEIEEWQK